MEKRLICTAVLCYFITFQTNAEDTKNEFLEERVVVAELEECIYRWAYNFHGTQCARIKWFDTWEL
jgi:hypothetical protein